MKGKPMNDKQALNQALNALKEEMQASGSIDGLVKSICDNPKALLQAALDLSRLPLDIRAQHGQQVAETGIWVFGFLAGARYWQAKTDAASSDAA